MFAFLPGRSILPSRRTRSGSWYKEGQHRNNVDGVSVKSGVCLDIKGNTSRGEIETYNFLDDGKDQISSFTLVVMWLERARS